MATENLSPEQITELGNPRRPEGEAGAEMLRRMGESHAEVTAWGLQFLGDSAHARILDIGCGGGAALGRMAKMFPGSRLTGLDYSEVSVAEASAANADWIEAGRMTILQGSVSEMPFADAAFDRITTVESFYFWPNPQKDLCEVRRVLAPGGRFLLIADIYGCDALSEHARENIRKYGLYNPDPQTFASLLKNAGFSDVYLHFQEGTTWICAEGRVS